MFLSSLYICKALQKIQTQCIIHYFIIIFLHAHPKKWQNNQRIDGGRILVELEVEVRVRSDRIDILKKYAYGSDRTRTVQIRVCSGTYA